MILSAPDRPERAVFGHKEGSSEGRLTIRARTPRRLVYNNGTRRSLFGARRLGDTRRPHGGGDLAGRLACAYVLVPPPLMLQLGSSLQGQACAAFI